MSEEQSNEQTVIPKISEYPEYQRSFHLFFDKVVHDLMKANNAFLQQLQDEPVSRIGNVRTTLEDKHIDVPPIEVEFKFEVIKDVIQNTKIEDFLVTIYKSAAASEESLMPQFFKSLSDILESAGRTFDLKGQHFSHDVLLDMFEDMDISFDENGKPNMMLVGGPGILNKMQNTPMTKDQENRYDEIIERKRAEFYAKKRTRKLFRQSDS